MCGIAGFSKDKFETSFRDRVIAEISHRGPDSKGFWCDEFIQLIHTRLAIIEPNSEANQPMGYEGLQLVFNGEIYNFENVRDELKQLGYQFNLRSDTEVILKAYDCWGTAAFDKFSGMFAIAIYDTCKKDLILARDPIGVKPLYYYIDGSKILFASELRPFFLDKEISSSISSQAVSDYFRFGFITHNLSILENVFKLNPGCYLKYNFSNQTTVIDTYKLSSGDELQATCKSLDDELLQRITDGCCSRLISDVPVGVLLSGGYDSSTVTAICVDKNRDLTAYSMGFDDIKFDESVYACEVAKFLKINVKTKICQLDEVKNMITKVPEVLSEPMADSSILPTMLISEFVKRDVKVVLSADGGDELFAGYEKYVRVIKMWEFLKFIPGRKAICHFLAKFIHLTRSRRLKKIAESLGVEDPIELMEVVSSIFTTQELNAMLTQKNKLTKFMRPTNMEHDWRQNLLDVDIKNYLVEDILVKVDRATMSFGLEAREPLLDKNLIEFARGIPFNQKINSSGEKKFILKKITHKFLPTKLMTRTKMGFSVPMSNWLRTDLKPLVFECLNETFVREQAIFQPEWINNFIEDFYNEKHDDHEKVWTLVIFQLWYKRWFQQNAA